MIAGAAAIVLCAWRIHMRGLIPLVVAIVPLLFLRHRYDQRGRWGSLNAWFHWHIHRGCDRGFDAVPQGQSISSPPWSLGVLVLATLNNGFYLFLSEKRGRLFAVAAFPFHLLYHFYNGVSFVMGSLLWSVRAIQARTGDGAAAPPREAGVSAKVSAKSDVRGASAS